MPVLVDELSTEFVHCLNFFVAYEKTSLGNTIMSLRPKCGKLNTLCHCSWNSVTLLILVFFVFGKEYQSIILEDRAFKGVLPKYTLHQSLPSQLVWLIEA